MKNWILILVVQLISSVSLLASEDSIASRIDTVVCTIGGSPFTYEVPYDTTQYNFQWLGFDGAVIDSITSFIFVESDSIILYSESVATIGTCYIDSIYVSLSFLANPDVLIPDPMCFDGNPIEIIENTTYDSTYTNVNYSLSDGQSLESIANTLLIDIDNGDTLIFTASYDHSGCGVETLFSDTVFTLFKPVLDIETNSVCFGDSTFIFNNSDFDINTAEVIYTSPSLFGEINNNAEIINISPSLLDNGVTYPVEVIITQGTCTAAENFSISTLLQPTADFSGEEVCENEFLQINNLSENIENASYSFSYDSQSLSFNNSSFILDDTIARGSYSLQGVVENANGCIDTAGFTVLVDSVTYVSFENLLDAYCENQDFTTLQANVAAGTFSGNYIFGNGDGTAVFAPTMEDSDVLVTFMYTNEFGCTDTYTDIVDTIYAKPVLELSGLDDTYCELGESDLLSINQSSQGESIFTISSDAIPTVTTTSLEYTFDPIIPGIYTIQNMYTDVNGCFNTITNSTIVNPLPMLNIDSLKIIVPGTEIIIGNIDSNGNVLPDETNVAYDWSNEDVTSTTLVSQPGIYFITATNVTTGCSLIDSLILQYDENYNTVDLESISIFPNPASDMVSIKLSSPSQNISIVNTSGEPISIGGVTTFITDQSGLLELNISNLNPGYYYLIIQDIGVFLLIKL